ncbi:MAG: carotenoid biosynthesis protein [Archangium sp.]|nr:carotenoid biosynthesis protein [Archangium sp.]
MTVLLTAWACLAAGFTAVALTRLLLRSGGAPHVHPERGVTLLRPMDSPSAGELENLRAVPAGVEQVVLSPVPPPSPYAGRWAASDPPTANRKLGHLQHALPTVGRAVVMADADVEVDDQLVDALLEAIDSGAELAWAAPRPSVPGATRSLLVQSVHSFEVLGVMALGAASVCGKAMALGPRAMKALAELPDCIGEDLELARVLHAAGLKVVQVGRARIPRANPSPAVARFTRWMEVLKAHRPAQFPTVPLVLACTPLLVLAAAVSREPAVAISVAVLVVLRAVVAAVLERRVGVFFGWFGAEALLLWCWLRALTTRGQVTWRGRALVVGAHGLVRSTERGPA